ncbi:hypothetical protein HMI54_011675 [Coelomomyces lativittatus]|nr:hypothetical protein HMI54_011675 [Coelomomyces lativittatus]
MQEKTARSLGINITEGPSNIRAFDGSLSSTKGGASSVLVDIGGVHGRLYFVIVDRANDEVILGRPFEMAFQTTSAVLGDGTYTGTVQNHDGTKKVSLSILKGNANRENVSGFGAQPTYSEKTSTLPFTRVKPEYENLLMVPVDRKNMDSEFSEEKGQRFERQSYGNSGKKESLHKNNKPVTHSTQKDFDEQYKKNLKKNIMHALEKKYMDTKKNNSNNNNDKKKKSNLASLICNMMAEIDDEEQLEEIDEYLINSGSFYPSFDHLIQIDLERKEEVYLKVHTINTIRKKVADKVRPQNVPLPEDARLEFEKGKDEVMKVWDRLTPENISKIKFGDGLNQEEKIGYLEVMNRYQSVLGFEPGHLGRLKSCIENPLKLRTVEHQPWQLAPMKFSQAEWDEEEWVMEVYPGCQATQCRGY